MSSPFIPQRYVTSGKNIFSCARYVGEIKLSKLAAVYLAEKFFFTFFFYNGVLCP